MGKEHRILILTDTILGAKGIKNILSKNFRHIKILSIQKGTLEQIDKFAPSTIIYYRYKIRSVGYDAMHFFLKRPDVNLISFNLDTNQMISYYHKTIKDAQVEDLFDTLNSYPQEVSPCAE